MFDHIGLRISDLDASVRFYTATLAPLGYVLCSRDDSVAGFGPKGEPSLWLHLHKGKAAAGASPLKFRQASRGKRKILQERLALN